LARSIQGNFNEHRVLFDFNNGEVAEPSADVRVPVKEPGGAGYLGFLSFGRKFQQIRPSLAA
jgi:hypothetical protein